MNCPVMRRKRVRHGTISMVPVGAGDHVGDGGFQETGHEWRTEPCGVPLFGREREAGICRGCASGWEVPENYPVTTLDQFRATGRDCDDLGAAGIDDMEGRPGRLYGDEDSGLHIERDGGEWLLTIANCSWSGALADMEAELYAWALSEHFFYRDED